MLHKIADQIYDTNYRPQIKKGGYPIVDRETVTRPEKLSFMDRVAGLFVKRKKDDGVSKQNTTRNLLKNKSLEDQLKYIINLDDDKFKDTLLTSELRKYIMEFEKEYVETLSDYKSHIAPSYREVSGQWFNISGVLGKTYYTQSYPSYIDFLRSRDLM